MKQRTIIAIVLAALVLLTAVQAFQLNSLKSKVEDGGVVSGASASNQQPSSGDSSKAAELPASLQDLPQMVGGC